MEIPEGVKVLDSVFQECSALETVTLPEGVTSISGCFVNCTALREVTLPEASSISAAATFRTARALRSLRCRRG